MKYKMAYEEKNIITDRSYSLAWTQNPIAEFVLEETNKVSPIKGKLLEPAFGNGVFIRHALKYPYEKIDGYEIHKETFDSVKIEEKNVNLYNQDFLLSEIEEKYDLVMGGFPFIGVQHSFYDQETKDRLIEKYGFIANHLRMMHIFTLKTHEVLKDGGFASIILHKNTLTRPNMKKLRKFINERFKVHQVEENLNGRPRMISIIMEKGAPGGRIL